MGCDIHAIFEVKQNGKWCYVPDLPDEFDDRCYAFFAMLNRYVRNRNDVKGFEPNGLPDDMSGQQFRFRSAKKELERGYAKDVFCCFIGEYEFYNTYDGRLETIIDMELYEHLCDGMTDDEALRYYYPRHRFKNGEMEYVVQDASVVGGQFLNVPYKMIYRNLKEYNDAYYKYVYLEEFDDFGYYEADFTSADYHGHSYLTLAQLKQKVKDLSPENKYVVCSDFIEALLEEIDELPECFLVVDEDTKNGTVTIGRNEDSESFFTQKFYNDAVKKVEEIKKKYAIQDDENVRVIFAFDS